MSGEACELSAWGWVWGNKYQTLPSPTNDTLQMAIWSFPLWVSLLKMSYRRVMSPSTQSPGDLLWYLWLITWPSSLFQCHPHQFWSPPVICSGQNSAFFYCINCWVWCSFAPRLVSGYSPLQGAVQPSRGKTDGKGGYLWVTERMPSSVQACHAALPAHSC